MHVDGLRALELPRACGHLGTDWTEVDNVARHFRADSFLDVHPNLHVVSPSRSAELVGAGDLIREPDAAGAVDAAGHDGLDKGTEVFVLDRALAAELVVAAAVGAIAYGLILQVALAALVANWAVEGMVGEQEFHHALARLVN
ncbi:hypothetical protein BC936DRAFT_143572 [Jimgerdemannia flammicorona]|uniref:Uncharacterized protein n=1 Tax=Jimgerdemannia flammicorona TaxID=994334 RepID=A0A432ZZ90_9FUNG|nr:hypothetical protein BC936DRAFT_143572 [Jimgerdemannia flammicorona]